MATPEQMEKKRSRQTAEILEAVTVQSKVMDSMVTEIVALKADERPDRTDEILAVIANSFGGLIDRQDRILSACAMMTAEIAGLKEQMTPAMKPPATQARSSKPKK